MVGAPLATLAGARCRDSSLAFEGVTLSLEVGAHGVDCALVDCSRDGHLRTLAVAGAAWCEKQEPGIALYLATAALDPKSFKTDAKRQQKIAKAAHTAIKVALDKAGIVANLVETAVLRADSDVANSHQRAPRLLASLLTTTTKTVLFFSKKKGHP